MEDAGNTEVPKDIEIHDEPPMLSALLHAQEVLPKQIVYFARQAKLNELAMDEYGLNANDKSKVSDFTMGGDEKVEYLEKFDSRGKKMKLKLSRVSHPPLAHLGVSLATVNLMPKTLVTQ